MKCTITRIEENRTAVVLVFGRIYRWILDYSDGCFFASWIRIVKWDLVGIELLVTEEEMNG